MGVSKIQKSNGAVLIDLTSDTVAANNLLQGATAHGANGDPITGAVVTAPLDSTLSLPGNAAEASAVGAAFENIASDAWSSSATYAVGAYCIYNNKLWKCKVQHSGIQPSEGTYWTATNIGAELQDKEKKGITSGIFTVTTPTIPANDNWNINYSSALPANAKIISVTPIGAIPHADWNTYLYIMLVNYEAQIFTARGHGHTSQVYTLYIEVTYIPN